MQNNADLHAQDADSAPVESGLRPPIESGMRPPAPWTAASNLLGVDGADVVPFAAALLYAAVASTKVRTRLARAGYGPEDHAAGWSFLHTSAGFGGADVAAHEGERARALDSLRAWNRCWARAAELAVFSDLRVARDGRFFEAADARHVDITQRDALRRLLVALVEARLEVAGEPVPIATLIEIGWPGEHVPYQAGWARLRAAVKMLRALGLRELIVTRNGGYLLDEAASVEWAGC